MGSKLEKWLRYIWFVNGVILLLLFVAAGVNLVTTTIADIRDTANTAYVTPSSQRSDQVVPRAVRFSQPIAIRGTETQFIRIYPGAGYYNTEPGTGWFDVR